MHEQRPLNIIVLDACSQFRVNVPSPNDFLWPESILRKDLYGKNMVLSTAYQIFGKTGYLVFQSACHDKFLFAINSRLLPAFFKLSIHTIVDFSYRNTYLRHAS
jgi:hypothetical protein